MATDDPESEFSLTVSRAMQLLRTFSADRVEIGLTELSHDLAISKAATSRLIRALQMHHFIEQNPQNRKYSIGAEALRIGNLFAPGHKLEEYSADLMHALVAKTGFTSYISLLKQDAMVLTFSVEGSGPVRYSIPVGTRLDVHASATGKAALATLSDTELEAILARAGMKKWTPVTATSLDKLKADIEKIRARGYSLNWEELTLGVGSVAAPIYNEKKGLLAILSIGFATSQVARQDMPQLGERVVRTANEISLRVINDAKKND